MLMYERGHPRRSRLRDLTLLASGRNVDDDLLRLRIMQTKIEEIALITAQFF